MRTLVFLLVLANLTLFGYIWLDRIGGSGEAVRLSQQIQPEKIKVLTPQQVAALGPAKVASLADVCVEWGPMSEADRLRAQTRLEPLDLGKLVTQRKVEVIANYWVFIPASANKAAVDKRVAELKGQGVRDIVPVELGPQRLAISLGVFRTEEAAQARLAALEAQGVKTAKVEPRAQSVQQTVLIVRDPPAQVVARLKEMQSDFQGSEIRIGSCERPT
jgi:sporulation related protein